MLREVICHQPWVLFSWCFFSLSMHMAALMYRSSCDTSSHDTYPQTQTISFSHTSPPPTQGLSRYLSNISNSLTFFHGPLFLCFRASVTLATMSWSKYQLPSSKVFQLWKKCMYCLGRSVRMCVLFTHLDCCPVVFCEANPNIPNYTPSYTKIRLVRVRMRKPENDEGHGATGTMFSAIFFLDM